MSTEFMFVLAIFHAVVGVLTTAINLYVTHRRTQTITRKDSATLRVALAAELANLRELYKDNVDALYAGKDTIASCRMFSVVYRANLGRLHTLSASDVPAVVTAYAMSERIEAYATAHCKGHGATAFSLGKERPFADALIAMYEKGAAAAERALRALGDAPLELPAIAERQPAAQLAAA